MDDDSKLKSSVSPLPDRPVNDRSSPSPEEPSESAALDEEEQYAAALRAEQQADAAAAAAAKDAAPAGGGLTAATGVAAGVAAGQPKAVTAGQNLYKFYGAVYSVFTFVGTLPAIGYLNYYALRSLMGSKAHPMGIAERIIVAIVDFLILMVLILALVQSFLILCVARHPVAFWTEGFSVCGQ